jgi:hypothetical protein
MNNSIETCHRCRITDKDKTQNMEVRFYEGIKYFQNRSQDVEISLDCFMNELNTTIKQAKINQHIFIHDIVPKDTKWNELL